MKGHGCGRGQSAGSMIYAFMFTNCGSPCIFQGGEYGLDGIKGNGVEHNRECMPWDNEDKVKCSFYVARKINRSGDRFWQYFLVLR